MREDDFEKTMEAWAGHEIGAAPEMRPTAEMYRLLQARQKEKSVSLASPRWALAGAAIAGLLVLALLYGVFFRAPSLFEPPPGRQVALSPLTRGVAGNTILHPGRSDRRPADRNLLASGNERRSSAPIHALLFLALARTATEEVDRYLASNRRDF